MSSPAMVELHPQKQYSQQRDQHQHQHQHQHQRHADYSHADAASHPPSTSLHSPPRVHTLDLKAKLASALGNNGKRYWTALLHFCSAKISRQEFEQEARSCLRPEHVHLHNALVLGIIYNASSAVPGPSSTRGTAIHHHSASAGAKPDEPEGDEYQGADAAPPSNGIHSPSIHPRKRLRLLVASLTDKERQRIKTAGRQANKSAAAGASALSWAGAGADLLEKRRKEEEKRTKEAEKRRLREVHTEIGGRDWVQEAISEELAKQENRAKLPVATLQALLRSSKVPLCSESKMLPDVDSLSDLMTAQAVENGLNGGVSAEAASLLLAGLQSHLQNLASSVLLAVRSNRAAGGIRTSRGESVDANTSSTAESSGSADATMQHLPPSSTSSSAVHSPLEASVLQMPDGQSYPISLRNNVSLSSRNSAGSGSAASTTASSIFTTGRRGAGPDSSTTSFASTAPTSLGQDSEEDDASESRLAARQGDSGHHQGLKRKRDPDQMDVDRGTDSHDDSFDTSRDRTDDSGIVIERSPAEKLPHRPLFSGGRPRQGGLRPPSSSSSSSSPTTADQRDGSSRIGIRDLAFLFELSPHIVVEPLGISSRERLLGADAEDALDETLPPVDEGADSYLDPEEKQALAARRSALEHLRAMSATSSSNLPSSARQQYLIDQQGPLSLILDRTNREKAGAAASVAQQARAAEAASSGALHAGSLADENGEQNTGAASLSAGKKKKQQEQEQLSEIVDPVKLLAGLCD